MAASDHLGSQFSVPDRTSRQLQKEKEPQMQAYGLNNSSFRMFTPKQMGRMEANDFGGKLDAVDAEDLNSPNSYKGTQGDLTDDVGLHGIDKPVSIQKFSDEATPTLTNGHHRAIAARETGRKTPGEFPKKHTAAINNWLGHYTPPKA